MMKNDETPDYWRERTIFPGTVPKEVKLLLKNISLIDKSFFRKLIKIGLGYIQQTISPEQCEVAFENLCKLKNCSSENEVLDLSIQNSGVISILRAALKINLKTVRPETLTTDLIELGLPSDFAADICKVVFGPVHKEIFSKLISCNPHISKLDHVEWKVEQTLSNSKDGKVIEPIVVLELHNDEGEKYNFEVPTSSFHLLRQSTATILRQMEILQMKK